MLKLYLETFTIEPKDSNMPMDEFKDYIKPAIQLATHVMGLVTRGKEPGVVFYDNPCPWAKIIISVSFGKDKAKHLPPLTEAVQKILAVELAECTVYINHESWP